MNDLKNQNKQVIRQNDTILALVKKQGGIPTVGFEEAVKKADRNKTRPETTTPDRYAMDPNGYCWTHGFNVSIMHNSCSCKNKAPGHDDTADRKDIRGGSRFNKPTTWKGKDTS